MTEFDPAAWVDAAIEAGRRPTLIFGSDGRQSIYYDVATDLPTPSPGAIPDECWLAVARELHERERFVMTAVDDHPLTREFCERVYSGAALAR